MKRANVASLELRLNYLEKYSRADDFFTLLAGHMVTEGKGNRYRGT